MAPDLKSKISEKAGEGAGYAAGAISGAAAGAVIGSILPGAGTAAGLSKGFKIGSKAGSKAGKVAGSFLIKDRSWGNLLNEFINNIISFFVSLAIPIPVLGSSLSDEVARHKGIIVFFFLFICSMSCMGIYSLSSMLRSQNVEAPFYKGLPEVLKGYREKGFADWGVPHLSPLGGAGYENIRVTAYFRDINYYRHYGRWHNAVDLVPNANYKSKNEAYRLYGDVVLFATCSGNAVGRVDSGGANYIYITCDGNKYAVLMVHNKVNFIQKGQKVHVIAGQPVAVMGNTGHSYGAHIHYAVKDLNKGKLVNPWPFIKNGY